MNLNQIKCSWPTFLWCHHLLLHFKKKKKRKKQNTSVQKKFWYCFASKIATQLHQTNSNALFRFVFFQFRTTRTSNNNTILDQLYGTFIREQRQTHTWLTPCLNIVNAYFTAWRSWRHCTMFEIHSVFFRILLRFSLPKFSNCCQFFIRNTFYLELFEKFEKKFTIGSTSKMFYFKCWLNIFEFLSIKSFLKQLMKNSKILYFHWAHNSSSVALCWCRTHRMIKMKWIPSEHDDEIIKKQQQYVQRNFRVDDDVVVVVFATRSNRLALLGA